MKWLDMLCAAVVVTMALWVLSFAFAISLGAPFCYTVDGETHQFSVGTSIEPPGYCQ